MATTPTPVRLSDQQQKELGIRAAMAGDERSDFIREATFLFPFEEHTAIQQMADAELVPVHEFIRRKVRLGLSYEREKELMSIANSRDKLRLATDEGLYHMLAQVLLLVQQGTTPEVQKTAVFVANGLTDAKFKKANILQAVIDLLDDGKASDALEMAKKLKAELAVEHAEKQPAENQTGASNA